MTIKRIMRFCLVLVIVMGFLPLNPTVSYANDDVANGGVEINKDNFPDPVFRDYVKRFDTDPHNGDGKLSQTELQKVTSIWISEKSVSDLKGIEYFTNLKELRCYENKLTKLDLSKNTKLTYLNCFKNNLASLDLSNNTELTTLLCSNNNLTSLNLSHNAKLTRLQPSANKLASLDLSNNRELTYLSCDKNNLESLNLSNNAKLTTLECSNNKLANLDVSNNTKLTTLECSSNKLANLDVSNNTKLTTLGCSSNKLANLDVSYNTKLTKLWCSNNNLASLDVRLNTELTGLWCSNNNLASLDVGYNAELTTLRCSSNKLASLNLSHNAKLTELSCDKNQLTSLNLSNNTKLTKLECSNNNLTSLDVSNNTKLTQMDFGTLQYNITVNKDTREFKYSKFPKGFNKDKVKSLVGAKLGADALILNDDTPSEVTYKYKVADNKEMNVKLNVTYKVFDKDNVTAMEVTTQPTKLIYTDGENLDLTGLKVKLTDNQNLTKEVEFTDFETYKITTDPANKALLTVANNNKPVTLTTGKGKAETKALTVNPKVVGPIDPTQSAEKPADISKYWTVTFTSADTTKGTVAAKNTVYVLKSATKTLADIQAPEKTANTGYEFDKWEPALDAHTTIDKDMTIKAYFKAPTPQTPEIVGPIDPTQQGSEKPADTNKYWTVTFTSADTTKGTVAAKNTVYVLKSATKTLADIQAPEKTAKTGYEFDKWDPALDAHTTIDKDMTVKAYFKAPTPQEPEIVGPIDPTQSAEKPADISKYWTVSFTSADTTKGTVAAKNTVYVLKSATKTLADIQAPEKTANTGYEFDKWEPALDAHTIIDKDMTVKAYFKSGGVGPLPTLSPLPGAAGGAKHEATDEHAPATVKRIFDQTALGTMEKLVSMAFQKSDYAVITTKDGYWDALAASSLAGKYDCPILLSNYDALPMETINQLKRLGVKHVFISGGTSVLTNGVVSQLENMNITVERIAGNMASDTANLIADKVGHSDEAFLATSWGFQDALSASSLAFAMKRPIYLADYATSSLDSATLNDMKKNGVKKVVIVGGTAVVSSDVEGILKANGIEVERIAGNTCYETSKEFLKRFQGQFNMDTVGATTSWGFTDALAAAPFFGKQKSPVLLTDDGNKDTFDDIDFKNVKNDYIIGGEKAVSVEATGRFVRAIRR